MKKRFPTLICLTGILIAFNACETEDIEPTVQETPITVNPDVVRIIINEVLYDPASSLTGDANGDGTRSALDDEFIEFVNPTNTSYDLSGFKVYDSDSLITLSPRHIFPPNTIIPANSALVLFGGGSPTGLFGNSIVQIASSDQLNLSNSGDVLTLTNATDSIILEFDIEPLSNNPDESYTRNPDITGGFEQHNDNTTLLFSPGTRIDGSNF